MRYCMQVGAVGTRAEMTGRREGFLIVCYNKGCL